MQNNKLQLIKLIKVFGLLLMLPVVTILSQHIVEAATPSGTVTMTLNPGTSTIAANTATSVNVVLNTGTQQLSAIQIWADVTGNVPADLAFNPTTIAGLTTSYNTVTTSGSTKTIKVIIDTGASSIGYSTNGADVIIGTINFTSPASGNITITFNQAQTLVISNDGTYADILHTVTNPTYTVSGGASPSPTATQVNLTVQFQGVALVRTFNNLLTFALTNGSTVYRVDGVPVRNSANGTTCINPNCYFVNISPIDLPTNFVGSNYEVIVKGPVHLGKSFGTMAINAGSVNNLDLSGSALETANVVGDTVIDTLDYGRIIAQFDCKLSNTPAQQPVGKDCTVSGNTYASDVDVDGDVDIYDFSFLVNNYGHVGVTVPQ